MLNKKTFLFTLSGIILLYAFLEGIAFLGLVTLSHWKHISYKPLITSLSKDQKEKINFGIEKFENSGELFFRPTLGWGGRQKDNSSKGWRKTVNSQGLRVVRADREYSLIPQTDILRISTFGDSFTFGAEVNNEDTWEEILDQQDPSIEVLNFGVGAYGLDQAYLRFLEDGVKFNSDVIIIGFMSENIFRNVNVFRPFYNNEYAHFIVTKPRFLLENGQLVLLTNPMSSVEAYKTFLARDRVILKQLGEKDYHYQTRYHSHRFDFLPSVKLTKILVHEMNRRHGLDSSIIQNGFYNVDSEGFKVTEKIFDHFYRSALDNGALPLIVVFPDRPDLIKFHEKGSRRYRPLIEVFKRKKYRFIDGLESFLQHNPTYKVDRLSGGRWGHYTPFGNQIIGLYIFEYLKKNKLTDRNNVKKIVREEQNYYRKIQKTKSYMHVTKNWNFKFSGPLKPER